MEEERKYPEKSHNSFMPIIITIGLSLFFFGLIFFYPIAIAGVAILALSLLAVFKQGDEERYAIIKESKVESWPLEKIGKEKTGTWLFIMSDILLFGSIIVAYLYIRDAATAWPVATQVHDLGIGLANTLILLSSSFAFAMAVYSIRRGNIRGLQVGLIAAFVLGFIFDEIKLGFEWPMELASGLNPTTSLAASTYYAITGLHAAHVAAGLVGISYLLLRAFRGGFSATSHTAVITIALYWAFVDIVWIFLFPLFYLV